MLTEENIRLKVCDFLGVPSSMIINYTEETYEEQPPDSGNWVLVSTPKQKDVSAQIMAIVNAICVDFKMGMMFTTVVPLVGGGIPGPVSGVEPAGNGWITLI